MKEQTFFEKVTEPVKLYFHNHRVKKMRKWLGYYMKVVPPHFIEILDQYSNPDSKRI